MSEKEWKRLHVVGLVGKGQMGAGEGAEVLG